METSFIHSEKSTTHEIQIPELIARGIQLWVKRDDLLHPQISGNKWRKLKYNLAQAKQQKSKGIFTFGGAFSNHLLATAFACQAAEIPAIGFVRGDELTPESNSLLLACKNAGMQLIFLSREEYAMHSDKQYIDELKLEHPEHLAIPEGGANFHGIVGCQEIWKEIEPKIDACFVAQGTTTTSSGLLLGKPKNTKIHVIPVLKGFDSIGTMQQTLRYFLFDDELTNDLLSDLIIHSNYHFGGYGKYTPELLDFITEMFVKHQLPLDPIYTAKAFWGMLEELHSPEFDGKSILFYHSGGILGGKSIEAKENRRFYPI